jgi:hypothetical protein
VMLWCTNRFLARLIRVALRQLVKRLLSDFAFLCLIVN